MAAVVRGDPGMAAKGSQSRFPAFASPMHASVQYNEHAKAGLEEQHEAYPDICFALDGAEELSPKASHIDAMCLIEPHSCKSSMRASYAVALPMHASVMYSEHAKAGRMSSMRHLLRT